MDSTILYKNRDDFTKVFKKAFKNINIKLNSSLLKAILSALSEKDETSDICVDSKGNSEPDPDLRDTENVSLKEDIHVYFEREVKPHVPDAWIDESKTKIGYEIPFTRHFYKYQSLRPSEEIMKEIKELEQSILEKLKKVMGGMSKFRRYERYKDSGIEWIGEIPEPWTVKRIKYISSMISKGTTPSTIGQQILDSGKIRI
jgi:type I restriction enzyme M protein